MRYFFAFTLFSWLSSMALPFVLDRRLQNPSLQARDKIPSSLYLLSPDVARGESLFQQTCSSCHPQGNNVIAKERNLKKEALKNFIFLENEDTIANFVKDNNFHRGALTFAGKLSKQDFADVASFVYEQAMEDKW